MTIAVDFDGTIVRHEFPAIGKEIPGAVDCLKRLSDEGHRVILWSSREGKHLEEAVEFCRKRGLEFYAVNSEYRDASWEGKKSSRKISADVYIDDRNLGGLPDWGMVYDMVSNHLTFQEVTERIIDEKGGSEEVVQAVNIVSSPFKRRRRKRNFFQKLFDRCMEARNKF